MQRVIIIRYGEIGLKGKNRYKFENRLLENIRQALKVFGKRKISKTYGRIYVEIFNIDDGKRVASKLSKIFGIVSFSRSRVVERDITSIKQAALEELSQANEPEVKTFKIQCRRAYKQFPMDSPRVNREVGEYLLKQKKCWKVDVHNPKITVNIEIREEGAYVYSEIVRGLGGLPVGSTGKSVLLLSGGIDSPVAGWMAMKRGVEPIALHFYSFPFTSERSREKVLDLCRVLAGYSGRIKLYINQFTDIQSTIRKECPEEYAVTLMRRMMLRVADAVAQKENAHALFTGESLGQVASQTLESMRVINEASGLPVLRPLVALDKVEIVELAKRIGSYDISIRPYEDCCALFVPKHPVIRPSLERVREMEKSLAIEGLLRRSLEKTEILQIEPEEYIC